MDRTKDTAKRASDAAGETAKRASDVAGEAHGRAEGFAARWLHGFGGAGGESNKFPTASEGAENIMNTARETDIRKAFMKASDENMTPPARRLSMHERPEELYEASKAFEFE
eukprot:tig00001299_g8067.t1